MSHGSKYRIKHNSEVDGMSVLLGLFAILGIAMFLSENNNKHRQRLKKLSENLDNGQDKDYKNIENDWKNVGSDFQNAYKKLRFQK